MPRQAHPVAHPAEEGELVRVFGGVPYGAAMVRTVIWVEQAGQRAHPRRSFH